LPFGTDQKLNMRRAIDDGYATKLAWTEINQESLTSAIIDLLYNKNSNNVRYYIQTRFYYYYVTVTNI
jgi:UDP:flavonoid glycosyltransferase YjiC (YdhE family)